MGRCRFGAARSGLRRAGLRGAGLGGLRLSITVSLELEVSPAPPRLLVAVTILCRKKEAVASPAEG